MLLKAIFSHSLSSCHLKDLDLKDWFGPKKSNASRIKNINPHGAKPVRVWLPTPNLNEYLKFIFSGMAPDVTIKRILNPKILKFD